jgi:hypothetical protein
MVIHDAGEVAVGSSHPTACPGENTLLALVEGRLDDADSDDIAVHLRGCVECQEVLAEVVRPSPFAMGRRFGRYTGRRLIGAGGMGLVYEAFDPFLSRRVAIKLLRADVGEKGGDPGSHLRLRLLREAKALARLRHPNVVTIHDVGETEDGLFFIAMELVEGETLRRWLPRRARSWREILYAYLEAGRGLAAAHDAGVVHRDFKPSNVLVGAEGDRLLVTDFGLARMTAPGVEDEGAVSDRTRDVGGDPALTRTGTLLGSPAYMSPEQLAGQQADVRSDIFSFCVSLWAGLYGARPFSGGTVDELRRSIRAQRPSSRVPAEDVPARIRETIARGLRESPDDRPQDMRTLLDELDRQRAHEGLSRAQRILREADDFFPAEVKAHALPAVALSLLEGVLGEPLRPSPRGARADPPELALLEVWGRPMQRFMDLIGPYEWIVSHFITRAGLTPGVDGIVRFDPDAWYPYSLALEFARSEPFGPEIAHRIGSTFARAVLETHGVPSNAPFTLATVVRADEAFDRCLRLHGVTMDRLRAEGRIPCDRTYVGRDADTIEVQTGGLARCATSRGYYTGLAEYFGRSTEVVHCEGPCRDQGGNACRYLLRPRAP